MQNLESAEAVIALRALRALKQPFAIIKNMRKNVFLTRIGDAGKFYILKVIFDADHPLYRYIPERNPGDPGPSARSMKFHQLLEKYDLSPAVYKRFKIKGGYAIIMDYIPFVVNNLALKDPRLGEAIDRAINALHSIGIVHGDLHKSNIRYKKTLVFDVEGGAEAKEIFNVYLLDLDTAFFKKEYHSKTFPKQWLADGFDDMTDLDEYLKHERTDCKRDYEVDDEN